MADITLDDLFAADSQSGGGAAPSLSDLLDSDEQSQKNWGTGPKQAIEAVTGPSAAQQIEIAKRAPKGSINFVEELTPPPPTLGEQTVNVGRHVGGALAAAPFDLSSGLYGVARAFVDQANDSPVMREVKARGERTILDPVADWLTSQQQQGKAMADSASGPDPESFVGQSLKSGIRSVPSTVVALGLSAFGMPELGLGILSAQTGGGAYGDARDKGVDPDQAAIYAASQAAIEYGTEKIPVLKYFEDTKVGTPFARKLVNNILSELGGEEAATAGQDFNEWAVLHPERSFADYVRDRPSAALSTAIAVAVGSSVAVSAEHSLSKIAARNTPGIIETARDQSSIIMPEDDASPLPNELIAAGRAELAGAEAMPAADDILARNGAPKVGSRVSFNMGGRNVAGTINDAFSIDGGEAGSEHGVKITLDDGSVVSEPFSVLNDMGVRLAPLSDVPPEVAALGPEKSPSIFDVASGRSATENRRELRKSAYVANAGAAGSTSLSSMEADLRNGDTVAFATPDGDILYVSQSGKDEFHFKSDVQEAYFNRTQLDQVLDRAKAKVAMDAPKPTGDGANDVSPDDGPSLDELLGGNSVPILHPRDRKESTLPVQGRITSPFGHRDAPKAGASTEHGGIDIAVPIGTPVKAPAGGTVVSVGKDPKNGNFVRIDHGNGVVTGYAHLNGASVKVGDQVEAGQDFATSGNSGNSTGPHLHWTTKINGKPVDPTTHDFGSGPVTATAQREPVYDENDTGKQVGWLNPETGQIEPVDTDPGVEMVSMSKREAMPDGAQAATERESPLAGDVVASVIEEAQKRLPQGYSIKVDGNAVRLHTANGNMGDGGVVSLGDVGNVSRAQIDDAVRLALDDHEVLTPGERAALQSYRPPAEQVPIARAILEAGRTNSTAEQEAVIESALRAQGEVSVSESPAEPAMAEPAFEASSPSETSGAASVAPTSSERTALIARAKAKRTGPVDAITFLADAGGIRDDEGHNLHRGRNLQRMVPKAGPLIRTKGMTIDAAGELLHDAGYFGPPSTAPRPTEDQVLQFIERAHGTKTYVPDVSAEKMLDANDQASAESEARARSEVVDAIAELRLNMTDADIDAAVSYMARGETAEDAAIRAAEDASYRQLTSDSEDTGDDFYVPGFDREADAKLPRGALEVDGEETAPGGERQATVTGKPEGVGEARQQPDEVGGSREDGSLGLKAEQGQREGLTEAQRAEIDARQQQSKARRGGQEAVSDQAGGLFSAERDQTDMFAAPTVEATREIRQIPSGNVMGVEQALREIESFEDKPSENEHPGLIVKSLQTGKETVIQPKGTVPLGDDRREEKLRKTRDLGERAYREGDDATPPESLQGAEDLIDAWNAGYRAAKALGPIDSPEMIAMLTRIAEAEDQGQRSAIDGSTARAQMAIKAGLVAVSNSTGRILTTEKGRALLDKAGVQHAQSPGSKSAPSAPTRTTPSQGAAYGTSNKVFTADAAEKARALLKSKFNQINSGFDPELAQAGLTLVGFHIEAGARSFIDAARAVAQDLGVTPADIKGHLRSWYLSARMWLEDNGHDVRGMDDADAVAVDMRRIDQWGSQAAPESGIRTGNADESRLSGSDAGASPADVQPAAQDRGAGSVRAEEGARSSETVRGSDERGGQAAERRGERPADQAERGRTGSRNADRLSGRDAERRLAGENFSIEPGALDEERGPMAKARDNVAAIELVKKIKAEGRFATREEQDQIARYVGWGGLKGAFPDERGNFGKGFEQIGQRLTELLTEEEYATARRSIQYAHYTSETIVREMWRAAERLGFSGGRVFEPGMGTGNFAGMMTPSLKADVHYEGIEMDGLTADIAKALYPKWGIRQADYTAFEAPKDAFDLVIGNPPFSDTVVKADREYKARGFVLHDYFFAKSLDSVRPGGLLMFVTSAGTMNKLDTTAREYLADRAELVGAIRLPGGAFAKNAGTEVTTDIVILRKLVPGEASTDRAWTETSPVTLPTKDGTMKDGRASRYFVDNPDMVLGEQGFFDRLYPERYAVRPTDGDLNARLRGAIDALPSDVMKEWTPAKAAEIDLESDEKKNGTFYVGKDGRLMQQHPGGGRPVEARGKGVEGGISLKDQEIIRGLVPIRDALRDVYRADLAENAKQAESAREELNRWYDAFVAKNGPINKAVFQYRRPNRIQLESARRKEREAARERGEPWDDGSFDPEPWYDARATLSQIATAREEARLEAEKRGRPWDEGSFDPEQVPDTVIEKRPNVDAFMDDPESYRLRAIEHYNDMSGEAKKSRVFFESVVTKESEPKIESAEDALFYTLNQHGRVDPEAIANVAGISPADAIEKLTGKIFRTPDGDWQTAPKYLSGNVRKKLVEAEAAAQGDPSYRANVEALRAVIPPDLGPSEVRVTLGMPWVPAETVDEFATKALGLGRFNATYQRVIAQWTVDGDRTSAAATSDWGTVDRDASRLIADALNGQSPKIYDTFNDGTSVLNATKTQAAQDKLNAIKQRFSEWIWQDADRTERLLRYYNDNFNNLVAPEYDGAYLTTPSIAASWSWRPHQKRVIARILQDGNTYVAHAVGAGKTSEMIGAAMEMKRLGLVNKPMFVVPNHMLAQFTKEFYEQYPLARIMVADDSRNFIKDKRKQFVADMSVADIDAVIIKHSAFELIPLSDEYQARYIRQELDELRTVLGEMKAAKDTNRVTRAKIEGQIEKAEQRMRATMEGAKDQTFTFEETGIDFLFVDEAHLFRKLDFATSRGDVKGIDPKGSMASLDLFMKTRYLEERRPGRSHVLASGTPITNTMAELFSISRYLQPQALRERGLERFDAWAASFGDTVTELEQRADGSYKPVSRFARFVNVPELSAMVRQVMDVVTPAQLEQYVVRPKATRHMVIAEQSDAQSDYQSALAARMQEIENRSGKPKPGDDIMLTVINDGRHASIDMRLVDPTLPEDPGSKLMKMIDNVYRIWRETKNAPFHAITADGFSAEPIERGPAAQMIFSDLGIGPNRPFNVHKEIADELVRRGIPRNEIVLFNPLKNDVQKQRVFNDVNAGNVRILIGSVPKMGTGVNAQRRLRANHNLDPQWYPANDEQRNGRIIRQGNLNPEIDIYDYSTKGTYDSTMWGLMGKKAKFIEGFFRGDPTLRDMEDLGEASQYEQAKALTTNDPRILDLTEAKTELEKETRRKTAFERDITTSRRRAADARGYAESIALRIAAQKKDIARRQSIAGEDFKAVVDGKTYTDRAEFQTALDDAVDAKRSTVKPGLYKVGEIGGFDLVTNVTFKDHVGGLASSTVTRGLEFSPIVHADGSEDRRWREISASGSSASVQSYLARLENDLASSEQDLARETRNAEDFAARAANAGTFTGDARIAELQGTVNRIEAELSAEAAARDAARQGKADPEAEQIVKPSFEEPGEESNNLVVSGEADRAIQAKYRDVVDRMVARMEQLGLISHDVALHATDTIIGSPKAAGTYRYKLISIALKLARDPEATLNHEAIHALRALGVIKAPEWTALVRAAHADKKLMASINRRYSEYYKDEPNRAELLDEEAVADMFAAYSQGRYDLNRTPNRGLVRRALDKIGQWLGIVEKAAREAGLTAEQATQAEAVLRAIDDGTIGARRSQRDGDSIVKPSIEAGDKHEFESTETETRFREAMKGMGTPQSLLVRFKEGVTRLAEGFSRHWEHLPNVPGYAGLQQKLRALESAPQAARERTVRMLSSLTKDFSKDDLDLLARKVILDDLMWEVEQEHALPFGLTPETLRIERQRVDAIVERNPKVAEAVLRRKVVNRRVAQDLVEAGVLEAERIKNPAYFRHQVLEYAMSERRIAGDPKKKLRTPRWAQRMGSSLDINANLLEAEFDWLTKAFTDIPTAKAIEWIKKSEHNILPDIRQQAKDSNREALAAKIAEWEQQAENGDEEAAFELLKEKQFRKDIAIGFKFLGDALSESGVDHLPESLQRAAEGIIGGMSRDADKVFPLLSYILDNDLDGSPGAAMVLKAVSQRRMWMAQVLGRRYVDPSDIEEVIKRFAPEGYSLWSPEDGALLYTVKTLPEHVMDRMIDRLEAPEGVDPAEFRAYLRKTRDVLAIGTGRYRMVLPDEVVATLNNVRNVHNEGIFEHLVGPVLASWKRWTLINPRRVLKYNINNLSGDLDAIIAGNPSVLKRVPQAASELTRVALKKAKPSDLYIEAVDRGVFDSGLSVQEIPDINALSQFEKLTDADRGLVKKFADQTIGRAWHALQGTTQWRENVLRYAAYIDYAQRLAANEPMSKIGYGASVPEMVDAVVDQKDKAALLARDLVGDYGAISHYGADLRKYVIPFYSWMEINAKRYWRLTYNAYGQGIGKGIATGGGLALAKGVRASVVLSVRMGLLFGLIQLFNHLLFPDEEDELSRDQQRQMHLILGRDRNGEIITLRLQGAFSDALSWFGFSDVVDAMDAYEKGQTSALGVLTAAPKNVLNKVGTSISPVFTLPLESATQRKLWPDLFQTRFIRDRWRNLFQTFSLENEYDAAAKRPSRGYARSWVDSVIYRRSPDETAYNEARGLAYDWLRTAKGQEGAGGFSSPRSNALYDWRKSRVFGDKASEDRALDRMIELGMTKGDLNASIKRAAPLGPIAKKDRAAFVQSLTDEEYQKLVRAQEFYERTFLD